MKSQNVLALVVLLSLICMGLSSTCACNKQQCPATDPRFQPGAIRFARPTP